MIALGADEIVTMEGGQWMMHDASMMGDGQAADWEKGALHLHRQSDNLAGLYAKRMGISTEEARALMLAETWAFADESVELGLADRVGTRADFRTPADMQERMSRKHDLTRFAYRYASRADAQDPRRQTRAATTAPEKTAPPARMGRSIDLIAAILKNEHR